jgi:hypothetical protein
MKNELTALATDLQTWVDDTLTGLAAAAVEDGEYDTTDEALADLDLHGCFTYGIELADYLDTLAEDPDFFLGLGGVDEVVQALAGL